MVWLGPKNETELPPFKVYRRKAWDSRPIWLKFFHKLVGYTWYNYVMFDSEHADLNKLLKQIGEQHGQSS